MIDEAAWAAVELAGDVKGSLVDFALSPPFERHLRRISREVADAHPDSRDGDVMAVERLLFDFQYDDGTTVVDRFVRRSRIDGVDGFFEVLADAPSGATEIAVRCCLSDLEHLVVPTEPAAGSPSAQGVLPGRAVEPGGGHGSVDAERCIERHTVVKAGLRRGYRA